MLNESQRIFLKRREGEIREEINRRKKELGESPYSPKGEKGIIDRFVSKINFTEKCWEWNASKSQSGYGNFHVPTIGVIASRISYYIFNGDIPDGMFVCHKCDNPPCVNPDHLFLGTAKDNAVDCRSKNRCCFDKPASRRTLSGSLHWSSKLTESDVQYIRTFQYHKMLFRELAAKFSVNPSTIRKAFNGSYWKPKCIHEEYSIRPDGNLECRNCERIFKRSYSLLRPAKEENNP